jgi:hypothetical protein
MECKTCTSNYNEKDRLPKILTACGHTFCQQCLANMHSRAGLQCPDCNQITQIASVASLPTNQALLSYAGSITSSSLCSQHGKPIQAFCPTSQTLLCVDCLLTGKFKHPKQVDECVGQAKEEFKKDCLTCDALVTECLDWLTETEALRQQTDSDRKTEEERVLRFFDAVEGLVADMKSAAVSQVHDDALIRKEKLEKSMHDVKTQMEKATEIKQDQFLDKLEFLTRIKQRKEVLTSFKKCVGTLPTRTLGDEVKFNFKQELETLIIKLKLLTDTSQRPSTASTKGKRSSTRPSTASSKNTIPAVNTKNAEIPGMMAQPSSKNSRRTDCKRTETPGESLKRPTEVNIEFGAMPNSSKAKTPLRNNPQSPALAVQAPTSLAEKRHEVKTQKQNLQNNKSAVIPNASKPAPKQDLSKPSPKCELGTPKGGIKPKKTDKIQTPLEVRGESMKKPKEATLTPDKEVSKMTIKELDDQKISLLSESGMENTWERMPGIGTDVTMTFMNMGGQDNFLAQNGLGMGEHMNFSKDKGLGKGQELGNTNNSKDQSYEVGRYLDSDRVPQEKIGFHGGIANNYELTPGMINAGNIFAVNPGNAWGKNGPMAKLAPPVQPYQPLHAKESTPSYQSVFTEVDDSASFVVHQDTKDKAVCMGGFTENKKMLVEVYDLKKQSWITLEHSAEGRINFGMVPVSKNSLLIFGGVNSEGQPLRDSVLFSTASMSFTHHPFKLSTSKFAFAYTLRNSLLYISGGIDIPTGQTIRDSEVYDLAAGTYKGLAKMKTPRSEGCLVFCATMNSLVAIGGKTDSGSSLKTCERLNMSTGAWEDLPELLMARRLMVAQAINGFIYVAGGFDGEKPLCSVER